MSSYALLRSYLEGLCRSTGSPAASLYLPVSPTGLNEPVLIHVGGPPVARELAEYDSARRWAERTGDSHSRQQSLAGAPAWSACRSRSPDSLLIPLRVRATNRTSSSAASAERRRQDRNGDHDPVQRRALAWVALRPASAASDRPGEDGMSIDLAWLLEMGAELCLQTIETAAALRDPVTGLRGRSSLLAVLAQILEASRSRGERLGVALINPDGFGPLEERFERTVGDRAVKVMATALNRSLRSSDLTFRFGGAVFALVLPETGSDACRSVLDKVLASLARTPLLDGAVQLSFSAGFAVFDPDDDAQPSAEVLLSQADRALGLAKQRGGGVGVEWSPEANLGTADPFDRLNGLFTGHINRDYRNMALLWDAVRALSGQHDYQELGAAIVEWLHSAFKAERVALLSAADGERPSVVHGLVRNGSSGGRIRIDTAELDDEELSMVETALREGRPQLLERRGTGERQPASLLYAVPLSIGERVIGGLLFDGDQAVMSFGGSEQVFLETLAPQLALALDRARLAEHDALRRQEEQRRLRFELEELRGALRQAALIYESPQMESLVQASKRVASTDATVLITGQSGTGKELLARTVHELSPRREGPFVVVDCAALSSSLIESELFGHSQGAFTGARKARASRLAEAVGGTLLLDEVGELPLDVQGKLLRFVQEKQYVPLGTSVAKQVDVRIVAVTNRDLATEVRKGRFREDLYYRLSVVHLELPPLGERREDVMVLARHFLSRFAVRYQKRADRFSEEAQECLVAHDWPGNVRELQNRVLKGVVFSDGEELTPEALGFGEESSIAAVEPVAAGAVRVAGAPLRELDQHRLLEDLGRSLRAILEASAAAGAAPPLGRWLTTEMIVAADRAADGVARRGAAIVGLSESTFRRRLGRVAAGGAGTRNGERIQGWSSVRRAVERLVQAPSSPGAGLLARTERVLVAEIRGLYPRQTSRAAALLGVSPPTFRRRLAEL